jgi:hypothetical protein
VDIHALATGLGHGGCMYNINACSVNMCMCSVMGLLIKFNVKLVISVL